MTREALLRAAYEAWSRWDIEAVLELSHPDAEAQPILGANIGANLYRGHEGLRQWFDDLHKEWDTFETALIGIEESGDRALCTIQIHARGRASGAVIDGELYQLIDLRDGLIVRLRAFTDRDEAERAFRAT